jgi:DNA helicase HerA-like ATPase
VLAANDLSGRLEPNYHLVGHISGTTIPIGISVANTGGSHVAVLGMSGMGKTVVAARLCESLAENRPVIALDTTGEYASRLEFSQWTLGDFESRGRFVYEPQGIPPQKAAEFIEQCMTAGSDEYQAGSPLHRVVVLEEAHTFIPEFPLALRDHQSHIAKSTRYVMQSRKFGITFVLVSQRTAVVSKSALSQCENYIILKTLDKTSLEYFESLVGQDVRDAIPGLARYEAVCVGPAFNAEEPVIVKLVDR